MIFCNVVCCSHPLEGARFETAVEVEMNMVELLSLTEDGPQVIGSPLNWTLDITNFGYDSCVRWFLQKNVDGVRHEELVLMTRTPVDNMRHCAAIYTHQ